MVEYITLIRKETSMVKLLVSTACALAVLTGCPDVKAPKDPPMVPTPKAAGITAPAAPAR